MGMATIEEQIRLLEEEIQKTQYNKKTQHHIGKLKAKIARLRSEQEKRRATASASGGGGGYHVKKSGNATVALVGFPSVGKSSLLNVTTDAKSEVGSYDFTTLTCVPGIMEHRHARIQILDLPGLVAGASRGKGRGREVLSVVRSVDLVVLMVDVFNPAINVLERELRDVGMRLNETRPNITMTKADKGGIVVRNTLPLTQINEELVKDIVRGYGIVNATVVLREDINEDQLIDFLSENRIYVPAMAVMNKIDLAKDEYLEEVRGRIREQGWEPLEISINRGEGTEELKEDIFRRLEFIRVYMKPQGKEADMNEPMVIKRGSTIGDVCDMLHRDFRRKFRFAFVWGRSAKFPGQTLGLDHELMDEDVLSIIIRI